MNEIGPPDNFALILDADETALEVLSSSTPEDELKRLCAFYDEVPDSSPPHVAWIFHAGIFTRVEN